MLSMLFSGGFQPCDSYREDSYKLTKQKQSSEGLLSKSCSKSQQKNTCAACNFIKKETLAQVLSCEFCKNFQGHQF